MTVKELAETLKVSYRQARRIAARYRAGGAPALAHQSRGRPSPLRIAEAEKRRMVTRCKERYWDCGPTYARERLLMEGYKAPSAETVRLWLAEAGLNEMWGRKERPHRRYVPRAQYFGARNQSDGSLHRWFEERGPMCWVMATIDDATGLIYAEFSEYEGTEPAMSMLRGWIERHGIPLELYTDRKNCYVAQKAHTTEERLAGTPHHTDFTAACSDLGIRIINAHSPQAKGRIERLFRVLQDRLVKDMRYDGIHTIEAANRYLQEIWLPRYNQKVMKKLTRKIESVACPVPDGMNLDQVFSRRSTRTVNNDWTISYKNRRLQLLPATRAATAAGLGYRVRSRRQVELREWLDGSLHIYYGGREVRWVDVNVEASTPSEERRLGTHDVRPIGHFHVGK